MICFANPIFYRNSNSMAVSFHYSIALVLVYLTSHLTFEMVVLNLILMHRLISFVVFYKTLLVIRYVACCIKQEITQTMTAEGEKRPSSGR